MLRMRFWKNFDLILFIVTLLLVVVGILVLYSTTFKAANVAAPMNVRNQIVFALIGLAGFFITAKIDYRVWAKFTPWLYGVMIVLLGIVMVAGKTALGATRWINLGFFQFQPSELAKLVLIIVLAKFFADHYEQMDNPRYLILSVVYTAVPMVMVLVQPDLGTALVLAVIWLAMVLTSRVRRAHLVALAALGLVLLPVALQFLKPYQRQRLATFFNPTADPLGTGYNVVQSTIAVGSGQLTGRGLASGSQSQLNFLPSQHTDFIFAVLSEKLGFVGGGLLLLLFSALIMRGLVVAYRAKDRFGMFLATGLMAMFLFHIFVNVGMNMGIMPVTGIPLPFVSYGGTSLLIGLIGIGLLESIAVRRKKIEFGT
ncbi:MAG TPA: rod shape-determining protein RodA [Candidatus Saccharimonadales bacterium]|nr:rod shape-determining protein RodA [Candidatus Saccharimonadales bacterium]